MFLSNGYVINKKNRPVPRDNCSLGTWTAVNISQVPFAVQSLVWSEPVWALAKVLAAVASQEVAQQSR
jgi:hypothetical protein